MIITYQTVDRGFLIVAEGLSQSIEFDVSADDEQFTSDTKTNIALDGSTETLFFRNELKGNITATFIDSAKKLKFIEFFSSVSSGESFSISDGTLAVPILRHGSCILTADNRNFSRPDITDTAGTRFDTSFTYRVL